MNYKDLPYMLYADERGNIYDHPWYRMAGFSGRNLFKISKSDLIPMPEFSKLFYFPGCHPVGINPDTGKAEIVREIKTGRKTQKCLAVSAFLEPGFVRSHLPAVDYSKKDYTLPMWGYTAVGFGNEEYLVTGFRIEYNHRWDPGNYDDTYLPEAIDRYQEKCADTPLVNHLIDCAANNHCFAAKNLFLRRWEAPLPVARSCNASCLGCLSLQEDDIARSSHFRISFTPKLEEIVTLAVNHLEHAEDAIVSFGQGCEGEPLTEYKLIRDSIREIRKQTNKGTINLNTNGSWPKRVREIAEAGLDSIRISLNSARKPFYNAYYRPGGYTFEDVLSSIKTARDMDLYTMINYLVFPGVSDQEDEIEALGELIKTTGLNFIHFKNLNIDPELYLNKMPLTDSPAKGMKKMSELIKKDFPKVELGYFNQTAVKAKKMGRRK
ncbi:MAG: radical SAM protein [Deltaproteobacteria bacterium]|nr:radical SAM protein [Deltaproteobacteria bacterium]